MTSLAEQLRDRLTQGDQHGVYMIESDRVLLERVKLAEDVAEAELSVQRHMHACAVCDPWETCGALGPLVHAAQTAIDAYAESRDEAPEGARCTCGIMGDPPGSEWEHTKGCPKRGWIEEMPADWAPPSDRFPPRASGGRP